MGPERFHTACNLRDGAFIQGKERNEGQFEDGDPAVTLQSAHDGWETELQNASLIDSGGRNPTKVGSPLAFGRNMED